MANRKTEDLEVYAADVVTVGQYFLAKMLNELKDQFTCKEKDRYKYVNPVLLVNFLRSLPLKPSQDAGAFQLSESGCKVLDAVAGHPSNGFDTDLCTYALHQAWSRIQLKYTPSRFNRAPVLTQIILYELWEGGHHSFFNMILGHGHTTPGDTSTPLRTVEAGEYSDLLRRVTDTRLASLVKHGNFDGIYPQECQGKDGKVDNDAISYLMGALNQSVTNFKQMIVQSPEHAHLLPAIEHYAMLIYRVVGVMRIDKVDKVISNLTPVEHLADEVV